MGLMEDLYDLVVGTKGGTKSVEEGTTKKVKVPAAERERIVGNLRAQLPQQGFVVPEQIIDPYTYELLSKRQTPSMEARLKNIQAADELVNKQQALTGQDYILNALMGASDILSGTKYAPKVYEEYKNRDTKKLNERAALEDMYKGMGAAEVDLLKQQFQNLGQLSTAQQKAVDSAWKKAYELAKIEVSTADEETQKKGAEASTKPAVTPPKAKGSGGKKLKILTPSDTKPITEALLIPDRVNEMIADYNELLANKNLAEKTGSAIGGFFTETDVQKWEGRKQDFLAQLATARQKGVLSNQDIKFAEKEFPGIKNTPEEARRKLKAIGERVSRSISNYVNDLRPNYDVSMFDGDLKRLPKSGAVVSGKNSNAAAKEWLRKNPNHPKAPAVRKKLGL